MTSNLLFLPMGIPASALTISATAPVSIESNDGNITNLENQLSTIQKSRSFFNNLVSNSTYIHYTYDLGTTKTASCIIFRNAKKLAENSTISYNLKRSSDNISYTSQTSGSFSSASSFVDNKSEDFLTTFTESSAFRYWKMELSATSDQFFCSGFFISNFFDFGIDPEVIEVQEKDNEIIRWDSENGASYTQQGKDPKLSITLFYRGVSDTKLNDFISNILTPCKRHGIYIYSDNTNLITGFNLINCDILEVKHKKIWTDFNEIEISLNEVIG